MNEILKAVIPGIASFVLGPVGGLIAKAGVEFLGDKLGVADATKEKIHDTLLGMTSDQLVKLKELDLEFQKFCMENGIKLDLAQIEVNKVEAASENMFVAGWRPAVGWIGAFGLGYAAILEPLARFLAEVAFDYHGDFPILDTTITMQVLLGILGLGAMRSIDKYTGNGNGKH